MERKQPFPYSNTGRVIFIPQDEPFNAFITRLIEANKIITSYDSMWEKAVKGQDFKQNRIIGHSELVAPLPSLIVMDMVVAFETYLRTLDAALKKSVGNIFQWPPQTKNPKLIHSKPYNFFFSQLPKTRSHFRSIFKIDAFHGIKINKINDWIRFRHIFA